VRGVLGGLAIPAVSARLPNIYICVPRGWPGLPLPFIEGPPAITLAQVAPVSEQEVAGWQVEPASLERILGGGAHSGLSAPRGVGHPFDMQRLSPVVATLLLTAAGCQQAPSKLDGVTSAMPAAGAAPSGDLEARVRKLEESYAKNAEALDFLGKVYQQQKQQEKQQARAQHDPKAVFAVNIEQSLKMGLVEGNPDAVVTIVEAFDFA